jgi:hypothetical protein
MATALAVAGILAFLAETLGPPLFCLPIEAGGQTLPSPYYLQDDVQYFPPGPEFKLAGEAAAAAAGHASAPTAGPAGPTAGPAPPASAAAAPPPPAINLFPPGGPTPRMVRIEIWYDSPPAPAQSIPPPAPARQPMGPCATTPPPVTATAARDVAPAPPDNAADKPVSQLYFSGPEGMTVQWDTTARGAFDSEVLVVPARYNFRQGATYRLKLANIPGRAGIELYPSIEVAPAVPRTEAFLSHNAVPVEFTNEDLDHVAARKPLTKVILLPDPEFQELALAGVETLVSTRLKPGIDPLAEAKRRGAIIAILRLGNVVAARSGHAQRVAAKTETKQEDRTAKPPGTADGRVKIAAPLMAGARCEAAQPPSDEEVMRVLEKARPIQTGAVPRSKVQRKNVRIVAEPIADYIDAPRFFPSVGTAQLHHVHFKCIVSFDEVVSIEKPNPHTVTTEECREVVYIDHDHFHRPDEAGVRQSR